MVKKYYRVDEIRKRDNRYEFKLIPVTGSVNSHNFGKIEELMISYPVNDSPYLKKEDIVNVVNGDIVTIGEYDLYWYYNRGQDVYGTLTEQEKHFVGFVDYFGTEYEEFTQNGFIQLKNSELFDGAPKDLFAVSAVHSQHRGEGIGSSLLRGAIEWFYTIPYWKSISCHVSKENVGAIAVVTKLGFIREGNKYILRKL